MSLIPQPTKLFFLGGLLIANIFLHSAIKPELEKAIISGNTTLVKVLITDGAAVNKTNKLGWTPLHLAAYYGHPEIVRFLIANGAPINAQTPKKWTPLMEAALKGHLDVVVLLVSKGATKSLRNKKGHTAKVIAAKGNHQAIVLFLESGKLPGRNKAKTATKKDATQKFFSAAAQGNIATLVKLLGKGQRVNSTDAQGWTPLHHASHNGKLNAVRILMDQKADPFRKNNQGLTPLKLAQKAHQKKTVIYLKRVIKKLKSRNKALHRAARQGKLSKVKSLLKKGAQLQAKDSKGRTPLHLAVIKNHYRVVKYLVSKGASLQAKDRKGRTALTLARRLKRKKIYRFLKKQ
jgi:cytohesin